MTNEQLEQREQIRKALIKLLSPNKPELSKELFEECVESWFDLQQTLKKNHLKYPDTYKSTFHNNQ
jgi:hypothetical protein